MSSFDDDIAAIDNAIWLEAYTAARELCLALTPQTPAQRITAELRRLMLCSPLEHDTPWALAVDEKGLASDIVSTDPDALPHDAERAALMTVATHVARRRKDAAFAALDAVERRCGRTGRIILTRAQVHLAFDERSQAKGLLDSALASQPDDHITFAYATLLYVVADFAGAEHYVRQVTDPRYALDSADLLVGIAASRGDLAAELAAVTHAITLAPASEQLPGRLAHRALVWASLDDLDSARADLERAIDVAPADTPEGFITYVRHRLDAIDAAKPDTPHRRLTAFPTVLQKWNYCGPAVIELCLRYLGIEMTQDIIAEAVKKEEGTPMLAILEFLREQGLEARRVEATPERLRAAIDLGVPVILEDDYSNSLHVTVAMGYDDRLGILLVADPMTHAPRRQGIESRDALAGEHRYGGIAVLGRANEVTEELRASLDSVGLTQRKHIEILDELSRPRDDISPAFSAMTQLEASGRAREALALEPGFARAAVIEANVLLANAGEAQASIASSIAAARARFPDVSEFSDLASMWNERSGYRYTALAESVLSSVLDAASAAPLTAAAWSLTFEGERPLAYRDANDAFVRAPANPATTVALARVTVDDAIHRARTAGRLGAREPAFLLEDSHDRDVDLDFDDATSILLADRLTEAAVDMRPDDPVALLARGDFLLVTADLTRANQAYTAAIAQGPGWATPGIRLAHVLEAQGAPGAAELALSAVTASPATREGWSAVLGLIARVGSPDQIIVATSSALDQAVDASLALAVCFTGLARLHRSERAAAQAITSLAHSRAADSQVLHEVADLLKRHGLASFAVELLLGRLREAPHDAQAHVALASMLESSPEFRHDALRHAELAYELAPWAAVAVTQLGWMIVDTSPNRAADIAEQNGSWYIGILELRRYALVAAGRAKLADEVQAILDGITGDPGRTRLAVALDHIRAGRYARVVSMDVECEPQWDDEGDIANWLTVQTLTGNARRAVALLEHHPDAAAHRRVAALVARLGPGAGAQAVAAACRRTAELETDPDRVTELLVKARLAARDVEGIENAAGESVGALVACAERALDVTTRLRCARRAQALAPDDHHVLAALHAALFDSGHTSEAFAVAQRLHEAYPFGHQGVERLAEHQAMAGDPVDGLALAETAVSRAPYCSRAHVALSVAAAMTGAWDRAKEHAVESVRWNTDDPEMAGAGPDRMVLAAAQGHHSAFELALGALRRAAPLADVSRLESACRARLAQTASADSVPAST